MDSEPTLLMVPCFAGAPWQLDQLDHLQGWAMRTMRLPDHLDDLEKLADFVLAQARRPSREVVLPRTGHMFRFSHPSQYSEAVQTFLQSNIPAIGGAQ